MVLVLATAKMSHFAIAAKIGTENRQRRRTRKFAQAAKPQLVLILALWHHVYTAQGTTVFAALRLRRSVMRP